MKSTETKRGNISNPRRILRPLSLGVFALAGVIASYSLAGAQSPAKPPTPDERQSVRNLKNLIHEIRETAEEKEKAREKAGGKKAKEKKGEKEEEEAAGEWYEGELYRRQLRAYPNDTVDDAAYKRALDHIQKMPKATWLKGGNTNTGGGGGLIKVNALGGNILTSGASWEFVGPKRLPTPYRIYYGPPGSFTSGRVNGITYDPRIANRAYLTGAQGGLWRTNDSGKTWVCLTNANNYPFPQYATACAVSPANSNILYIGLGDFNGGTGAGSAQGMARSTDGGQTWGLWPADPAQRSKISQQNISAISINPSNPNQIILTTGRGVVAGGIFRSTDGGATFTEVTPTGQRGDWSGLEYSIPGPNGNRVYYAVKIGTGVFFSMDQGVTWQNANAPLAFNSATSPGGGLGLRVAASKVTFGKIFVLDASASSVDGRVFTGTHTTAAAPTWSWVDTTGNYPLAAGDYNTFAQSSYDLHITTVSANVNGVMRDILYGGAISLVASPDASANWTDISFTLTPDARMHNDQHSMAANPFRLGDGMAGNDGGVYGVTFNSVSRTFTINALLSETLGITQFYKADWDGKDPNFVIGGTQDNATPQLGGPAWRNVGGGDGGGCAIHIANKNIQYTTSQGGVIYATFENWTGANGLTGTIAFDSDWGDNNVVSQISQAPFVGELVVSPAPGAAGNYMFYGTSYLWRWNATVDAGGNLVGEGWLSDTSTPPKRKPMGDQEFTDNGFVTAIAVAPSARRNPDGSTFRVQIGMSLYPVTAGNVVYVGTSDGRLWYTQNALDADQNADTKITWVEIDTPTLPDRSITSISIDPNNPGDILVGVGGSGGGHVFRSTNSLSPDVRFTDRSGFATPALPDIHLSDITRDPADPSNTWYVATDLGVFATMDAGATWGDATLALGLPLVQCNAIEAMDRPPSGTGFLNVATYGRGMWRIALPAAEPPRFTGSVRYSRINTFFGPRINLELTLVNAGGTANNVRVTGATLTPDRKTPVSQVAISPTNLGTMGANEIRVVNIQFPDSVGPKGTAVTHSVNLSYDGGTVPPVTGRGRLP